MLETGQAEGHDKWKSCKFKNSWIICKIWPQVWRVTDRFLVITSTALPLKFYLPLKFLLPIKFPLPLKIPTPLHMPFTFRAVSGGISTFLCISWTTPFMISLLSKNLLSANRITYANQVYFMFWVFKNDTICEPDVASDSTEERNPCFASGFVV